MEAHRAFIGCSIAILLSAIAASACAPAAKGGKEPIRIAYTTTYGPVLVQIASAKGYLAEEGLAPELKIYGFGKQALQALLSGEADVATASTSLLASAALDGRQLAIIGSIQSSSRNYGLVGRRDRGIGSVKDLRGKAIGLSLGTASDYFLYVLLLDGGLSARDVRLVDLPANSLLRAIEDGRVDAIVAPNPVLELASMSLGPGGTRFFQDRLFTEHYCLIAHRGWVREHREAATRLLRSVSRASALVAERDEEARKIVAGATSTGRAVVDAVWAVNHYCLELDQDLLVDLEDQARWLLRSDPSKAVAFPPFLAFIDDSPLKAAAPSAARIIR